MRCLLAAAGACCCQSAASAAASTTIAKKKAALAFLRLVIFRTGGMIIPELATTTVSIFYLRSLQPW